MQINNLLTTGPLAVILLILLPYSGIAQTPAARPDRGSGNALHGTPGGDGENIAARSYDAYQANILGRKESMAELAGDDAGIAVGQLMLNTALARQSGNYAQLKAQIRDALCAF